MFSVPDSYPNKFIITIVITVIIIIIVIIIVIIIIATINSINIIIIIIINIIMIIIWTQSRVHNTRSAANDNSGSQKTCHLSQENFCLLGCSIKHFFASKLVHTIRIMNANPIYLTQGYHVFDQI